MIFANEFAYGLNSGSTLASMMPVIKGTIMPPINRKNHNKVITMKKSSRYGDGAATLKATAARTKHVGIAFFDS